MLKLYQQYCKPHQSMTCDLAQRHVRRHHILKFMYSYECVTLNLDRQCMRDSLERADQVSDGTKSVSVNTLRGERLQCRYRVVYCRQCKESYRWSTETKRRRKNWVGVGPHRSLVWMGEGKIVDYSRFFGFLREGSVAIVVRRGEFFILKSLDFLSKKSLGCTNSFQGVLLAYCGVELIWLIFDRVGVGKVRKRWTSDADWLSEFYLDPKSLALI